MTSGKAEIKNRAKEELPVWDTILLNLGADFRTVSPLIKAQMGGKYKLAAECFKQGITRLDGAQFEAVMFTRILLEEAGRISDTKDPKDFQTIMAASSSFVEYSLDCSLSSARTR